MTTPDPADDLRQRMQQIRCTLGEDMEGMVDNARILTDWRNYVKANPLISMGAAAVLGYLVVPTRVVVNRPVASTLEKLAKEGTIQFNEPKKKKTILASLAGYAVGMGSSLALQVGLSLANQALGRFMPGMAPEAESPAAWAPGTAGPFDRPAPATPRRDAGRHEPGRGM